MVKFGSVVVVTTGVIVVKFDSVAVVTTGVIVVKFGVVVVVTTGVSIHNPLLQLGHSTSQLEQGSPCI